MDNKSRAPKKAQRPTGVAASRHFSPDVDRFWFVRRAMNSNTDRTGTTMIRGTIIRWNDDRGFGFHSTRRSRARCCTRKTAPDCLTSDNREKGNERARHYQSSDDDRGLNPCKHQRAQCCAHHPERNVPNQQTCAAFRVDGDQPPNGAADG